MYDTIYRKWQKRITDSPYADAYPLAQKKEMIVRLLKTIFSQPGDIYYLLPEIIDFAESNSLKYKDFVSSFFILRDVILENQEGFLRKRLDVQAGMEVLQDAILKIGNYFSHLKMDLNITRYNVSNLDIDRFEGNILQLNNNFVIEKTNSALLKYFNYEKQEIIGKPIQFLLAESSHNILSNAFVQLEQNLRFKLDLEIEAKKKNGQRFQALLKIFRKYADEEHPKYTAYIKDHSYYYETKSMLNLLSMALESVGQGIVILEPDALGTILYVNEAMERMSGQSRTQLIGKPFSSFRDSKAQDNLEQTIVAASLKEGWDGEVINVNKNDLEYVVHLHTQPVINEDGRIVAIVGIEQDVTEQKAREKQIIHLKQFVEHIINHLPHFIIVTDSNLKIKFWNQSLEDQLSLTSAEALGKDILEILPALIRHHLELAAKNVLFTGKLFTKKILVDLRDTGEKYFQLYLTDISTRQEKQLLWSLVDITQEEMLKVKITWQNARLKFLENFSQILNSNLDLRTLLQKFTEELKAIIPFKTLSFYLTYDAARLLFNHFFFSHDGIEQFPDNKILDFSQSEIYQKLMETGKSQINNFFLLEDKINQPKEESEYTENIKQVIRIPIRTDKETFGILNIGHEEPDYFKNNDLEFFQQIASHLVIALRNSFYLHLVQLQNKKLSIINSIFNLSPDSKNIEKIFDIALEGLLQLLESDLNAFYISKNGKQWERYKFSGNKKDFPKNFQLEVSGLKQNTIIWDNSEPASPDIGEFTNLTEYASGLFSVHSTATRGYLGLWAFNNRTMDHSNHDPVVSHVQDVLKQMTISIDHIDLFKKVKQAEREWKTTFDAVNIGIIIVDSDFKIIQTNDAFIQIFNLKREQLKDKSCADLFCHNHPGDRCCLGDGDKPYTPILEEEYFDARLEKTLLRSFYPFYSGKTHFNGGVFVLQDITRQREQESKIRFLSKFPETNPNIVINLDNNHELQYVNPAAQKILAELKIPAKKAIEFLPGNLELILEQMKQEEKQFIEIEHKFRDRVFQYFIYYTPEDELFYFYGIDITEKLELQQHLLRTENIRAVGEMASGVAHDFNNLLATILGRTQLLLLKSENKELNQELQIIEKAAIDGGEIVQRIQEVTRERRDKNYTALDLAEIIKESIIFSANKLKFNTQLKGKPMRMHTDIEEDVVVKGNSVELKEVFTNLLLNAYDAMNNGGNLSITSKRVQENKAEIIIKDTGIGMPEEIKNKIFNPFFTTKGEKGTGLGLSIVYRTITSHGGFIDVDSAPNEGTIFTIILPVSDETVKIPDKKSVELHEGNGNVRLLIVDDEPELLDTMAEILRLKFNSVDVADSGKNAINKLKKQEYDIVLTDLGMPEMSGWELAKQIKKIRPDSKVILVTGWGDQARQELKHHPYVDEILPKPYELRNLIEKINKFSSV